MTCVKETLCISCVHREVCSKKEEYLASQTAVDELFVAGANKYLRDMKWIKPVQLPCNYYMSMGYSYATSTTTTRSTDDNVFGHIVGGDTIAR